MTGLKTHTRNPADRKEPGVWPSIRRGLPPEMLSGEASLTKGNEQLAGLTGTAARFDVLVAVCVCGHPAEAG